MTPDELVDDGDSPQVPRTPSSPSPEEAPAASGRSPATDTLDRVAVAGEPSNVRTSLEVDRLMAALAKAQAKLKDPTKDATNPHFKSRYADLAGGLLVARAALAETGIAIVQIPRLIDGMMILFTRLYYAGQWIETEWPIARIGQMSQQQLGSAETYARRYSLFPLVGITGRDDDDDGEAAEAAKGSPVIDADQVEDIKRRLVATKMDEAKFLALAKAISIETMTVDRYKDAIVFLTNRAKRQAEAKS